MSTRDQEVKVWLVETLLSVGIFGLRDGDLESDFVQGKVDPLLIDIGMDSLSEMELCIAIENHYGVTIVPMELEKMKTLGQLVTRIMSQL